VTRALILSGLVLWVGATLLLSELRWFSRRPLSERLRAYVPGGATRRRRPGLLSVESFRDAVGPVAGAVGGRVSRVFGVDEDVETRLRRVHSPLDVTAFRVRQIGWTVVGFGTGALLTVAAGPPLPVGLLFVFGAPLLAFLVVEQQLAAASRRWQRQLHLELPVVAEQLGMLLGAGYSLSAALGRVAQRGQGCCARDLGRVTARIRQGLSETAALREWSRVADVESLERLVSVLALNREAADLGRLIGEEARSIRRDVHRELVERMDKRGQQVWIPVTVAALVPGVIFLAIPFIEALQLVAN
jgi:tight adherence protein C